MFRHPTFFGGVCVALLVGLGGCPQPTNPAGQGGQVLNLFNQRPEAVAVVNPPTGVFAGTQVTLDGSGSTDPDGGELTFEWTQTAGVAVTLTPQAATAVFVAPFESENQTLSFRLRVVDPDGGEDFTEVNVAVGAGGEFSGNPQSASPYRDSLSSEEAYHLLRRATFGASPGEVNLAVARGLNATVDDLIAAKPMPQALIDLTNEYRERADKRWIAFMLDGPNPLRERLALFWHDRFASSRRVLEFQDRMLGVVHMDMLRANALGNYRQFLEDLTLDPLMLLWLNGEDSPKTNPNENYAREFWELFTLGRDVLYTEQDIREGARAFTGITLLREPNQNARPIYDLLNHDETLKLIFPDRAPASNYNYESVIDLTLAQPEAARYVAKNLLVALVHDHPSDALVEDLAQTLRNNNWELAPLVKRILTSQAIFSTEARYNQIASPVEHFVGVARTLEMHILSEDSQGYVMDRLVEDLAGSGQELLNPPGVEGWSENAAWLEGQWVISRIRALGRRMEYGQGGTIELPYHLLPAPPTWNVRETRNQIVDAIARVFHLNLTPEERELYVYVLDDGGYYGFFLQDPEDQPRHVAEMIRLMAMDERVIGR